MKFFRPRPILKRKTDGALFIASNPGWPSAGFYFREVRLVWRWWLFEVWETTGVTWEFHEHHLFDWEHE